MLAALWGRLQGWLFTAFAVAAVLVGAYGMGSRAARRSAEIERAEHLAAAERAARTAQERARGVRDGIDANVRRLPAGGAAERLRERWSRDR